MKGNKYEGKEVKNKQTNKQKRPKRGEKRNSLTNKEITNPTKSNQIVFGGVGWGWGVGAEVGAAYEQV